MEKSQNKLSEISSEIKNIIFERAYELEEKAIEFLLLTSKQEIDYAALSESALRQALKEWKENKQVFNLSKK